MTLHPTSRASRSYTVIVTVLGLLSSHVSCTNTATGAGSGVGAGGNNTAEGSFSWIGGGSHSTAYADYSSVGGGLSNRALMDAAVVAGGEANAANGTWGSVGGGRYNRIVSGQSSIVSGGAYNTIDASFASVGGGERNVAAAAYSRVGGGDSSTAHGEICVVAGGSENVNYGKGGVISGGKENTVNAIAGLIAGGYYNSVDGSWGTVSGGRQNQLHGEYGSLGGGYGNHNSGYSATLAGGFTNTMHAADGAIVGGYGNTVNGYAGVIVGGVLNKVNEASGAVGGGQYNEVLGVGGVVAGGDSNTVDGAGAAVGGGQSNKALGAGGVVAGGEYNSNVGDHGVVSGGLRNQAYGTAAVVTGGQKNTANGTWSTIAGGLSNFAQKFSVVGGGSHNQANSSYASISGGLFNFVYPPYGTVGGGRYNVVYGYGGNIAGGSNNVADHLSSVGGGLFNKAYGAYVTIGGGSYNVAGASSVTIAGGSSNKVSAAKGAVGGGHNNDVHGYSGTIAGGFYNTLYADYAIIGGGWYNAVYAASGTVGGGYNNTVTGIFGTAAGGSYNDVAHWSAVGGGYRNSAAGNYSNIAGGDSNTVRGIGAAIAGGRYNVVFGDDGVICGGHGNQADGLAAVISGGELNAALAAYATISGGAANTASGEWSCVTGGTHNSAIGTASLAQGAGAVAHHDSAAVLSFSTLNATCHSTGNSTITLCADHGVFVNGQKVLTANDTSSTEASIVLHGMLLNNYSRLIGTMQRDVRHLRSNTSSLWAQIDVLQADVTANNASYSVLAEAAISHEFTIEKLRVNDSLRARALSRTVEDVGGLSTEVALLRSNASYQRDQVGELYTAVTANNATAERALTDAFARLSGYHEDIDTVNSTASEALAAVQALRQADEAIVDNVTIVADELIRANIRIDALDVNTSTAKLRQLARDVILLEGNVTALDAGVVGIRDSVDRVNESLVELEALDVAILQSNLTLLAVSQRSMHERLSAVQQLAESTSTYTAELTRNVSANLDSLTDVSSNIDTLNYERATLWLNASDQQSLLNSHTNSIFSLNASMRQQSTLVAALNRSVNVQLTGLASTDAWERKVRTINASLQQHLTSVEEFMHIVNASLERQESSLSINDAAVEQLDTSMKELNVTVSAQLATEAANVAALQSAMHEVNASVEWQRTLLASKEATIHELETTVASLQSTVHAMNASAEQQRNNLAEKDVTITQLETTVASLQGTVHVMNDSLSSLTLVVEQMMKATTFAAVYPAETTLDGIATSDCSPDADGAIGPCGETTLKLSSVTTGRAVTMSAVNTTAARSNSTGCSADANGPCGATTPRASTTTTTPAPPGLTGADTTQVTSEGDATTLPLPVVAVTACETYPCGDDTVDVFSWSSPVAVVVSVEGSIDQFQFTLLANDGSVVWQHIGSSRFASFVPSDIGVTSADEYHLHASVQLEDGRVAEGFGDAMLLFASPPTLHAVDVAWINGSAAANWFKVVVDATDGTELWYEFFVRDTNGNWKYLAASGYEETAVVAVPSTRNLTLEVTVTNAFGSSETCQECPTLVASSVDSSSADVTQDAFQLVRSGTTGTSLFLAVIDVAGDDDSTATTLLEALLEAMQTNETSLSQNVVVLHALVQAGAVDDGFVEVLQLTGARITNTVTTSDALLTLYLATVDAYGAFLVTQDDALEGVAEMDEYLGSVCTANEAGSVPDGEVSVFQQDSVSLSCASSEDIVAVDTGSATVLAAVDGVSTVAVSTWNGTMNTTNTTSFLSTVHGVHVEGGREEGDAVAVESATTLKLSLSGYVDAVRKAMSCVYYDEPTDTWSGRGVVLRGMDFDGDTTVRAICASSHLTLFTVGDSSAAAQILESKIASFADRVDSMNNVNFGDEGTAINWSIMGAFVGITVLFAAVIVIAKVKGRKAAVDRGRLTFQQDGQLTKPNVLGSRQYEAVLRRWVSGRNTAKLITFELLTSNAVLGMLFHWDHEAVVFGQADKAVILFGAVLMTFVSSAFLFEPNESVNGDLLVALWSVVVTAVLTNALLLPVQHFLPYMVSNVNSMTTRTRMPTTLLKREMKRLSCCKSKKRDASNISLSAKVVMHWVSLRHEAMDTPSTAVTAAEDMVAHVSTKLHFLHCGVELPAGIAIGEPIHMDVEKNKGTQYNGIERFQRLLRWRIKLKREVRNVEFGAWYNDLHRARHALAMLSACVLLVLAAFTLTICLLLSCAFNEEESVMWVADVAQSLVVQIFVTDPAITLVVIFAKLLVSWTILRIGKRRLKKKLQKQQDAVEQQIADVSARVDIAAAEARALEVVVGGVEADVARAKVVNSKAKEKCEVALEDIAVAKARLRQMRRTATRPRKSEVQEWDNRDAELDDQERAARKSLGTIDAALEVLGGSRASAEQKLEATHEKMRALERKLEKATKAKVAISVKKAKVEDKPVPVVKKNAVMPIAEMPGPGQHEPSVVRAAMPLVHSAADLAKEISVVRRVDITATTGGARRRRRQTSVVRKRTRRSRAKPASALVQGDGGTGGTGGGSGADGGVNGLERAATAKFQPNPEQSGEEGIKAIVSACPRRAMTWSEIRALQKALKDQAASSRLEWPVVFPRRRRRSMGNLSPATVKLMLERRERRRLLLEQRATEHDEGLNLRDAVLGEV